jgi:hypothetical protein
LFKNFKSSVSVDPSLSAEEDISQLNAKRKKLISEVEEFLKDQPDLIDETREKFFGQQENTPST